MTAPIIPADQWPDEFRVDNAKLIGCINALLSMDAAGALVPHGIGGHARSLLSAAAHRLAPAPAIDLEKGLRDLYRAYVRLLESGRDRIRSLGGDCDPVDVMERSDIDLRKVRDLLALIDGQAAPRPLIARPLAEWHEDSGPVTWWAWCGSDWAGEPAWCGTPNDGDWPGYHTHWTPHPAMPMQPTTGEGE